MFSSFIRSEFFIFLFSFYAFQMIKKYFQILKLILLKHSLRNVIQLSVQTFSFFTLFLVFSQLLVLQLSLCYIQRLVRPFVLLAFSQLCLFPHLGFCQHYFTLSFYLTFAADSFLATVLLLVAFSQLVATSSFKQHFDFFSY